MKKEVWLGHRGRYFKAVPSGSQHQDHSLALRVLSLAWGSQIDYNNNIEVSISFSDIHLQVTLALDSPSCPWAYYVPCLWSSVWVVWSCKDFWAEDMATPAFFRTWTLVTSLFNILTKWYPRPISMLHGQQPSYLHTFPRCRHASSSVAISPPSLLPNLLTDRAFRIEPGPCWGWADSWLQREQQLLHPGRISTAEVRDVVQLAECCPSMRKVMGLIPSPLQYWVWWRQDHQELKVIHLFLAICQVLGQPGLCETLSQKQIKSEPALLKGSISKQTCWLLCSQIQKKWKEWTVTIDSPKDLMH